MKENLKYIEDLLQLYAEQAGGETGSTGSPQGVEWKTLGKVAELKRGTTITAKSKTDGNIPVISGGQKPAYYNGEFNRDGETITVAGSGAYAGFVMYWNEAIFVSDAFSIKADESKVLPRYIYHFLLNIQDKIHDLKSGGGVPHVYAKDVARFQIPIPPLPVQQEIVRILDKFTTLTAELTAELTARKKQYAFYREQLLMGNDKGLMGNDKGLMVNDNLQLTTNHSPLKKVQWKTLGEVTEFQRGYDLSKTKMQPGAYPVVGSNGIIGYHNEYTTELPVITVGRSGSVGKIKMYNQKCWAHNTTLFAKKFNGIIPRYLYYLLQILNIPSYATGAGVPTLNRNNIHCIKIPIPPLSEQERIVAILDKFDTLTNSISEGLPKEIELRQKQYAYYRDRLLTFTLSEPGFLQDE